MEWTSNSPDETRFLGTQLLRDFPELKVICLYGSLGSGKTCFVKGIGEALGIEAGLIKSPTFTHLFEYQTKVRILYHFDFYRQEELGSFDWDWWNELLGRDNDLLVVEWADRIFSYLPENRLDVRFISGKNQERKLEFKFLP
ncbi:MAG: hypothetical protein UT55_C0070G0006 [Candidatus Peregrinibacteria bacterium GW2011_GWE2_39_6]|nr:MAG: hypothetical protein UT36_C0005G0024 [Candidatus Peregrinibacteria bacterium GW2011_GWF2_39_17]KKR24172.1 MAG: hypothetical protein UT55_C0070G0006 [Candidatus Peregrinibacteria bacterium GW2011_GWE2_39_6]HCW32859.1 tRNA (adenosine(37)-N6)-threonylcarbamoyltransferase complex ATPase subunit type 1 TsaE [Candidatus Peregrinibacteria bacterium]